VFVPRSQASVGQEVGRMESKKRVCHVLPAAGQASHTFSISSSRECNSSSVKILPSRGRQSHEFSSHGTDDSLIAIVLRASLSLTAPDRLIPIPRPTPLIHNLLPVIAAQTIVLFLLLDVLRFAAGQLFGREDKTFAEAVFVLVVAAAAFESVGYVDAHFLEVW
jgi:hypothetical protein